MNWLADCLASDDACKYIGHKMEFRNWDTGWHKMILKGFHAGQLLFETETGSKFQFCRLPKKHVKKHVKKRVPWTPKSAPMPLALRQTIWLDGMCLSVTKVDHHGLWLAERERFISFEDLADPDNRWETRDGTPCCDFEEVEE